MGEFLKKVGLKIVSFFLLPLVLLIGVFFIGVIASIQQMQAVVNLAYEEEQNSAVGDITYTGDTLPLSPKVEAYRDLIQSCADKYEIGEYTDLMLAILMQEWGGADGITDIYQCSESLGLPPNTLETNASVVQACQIMKKYITNAGVESPSDITHIKLALQAYNFGSGFIQFANDMSGGWSKEAVDAYAKKYSKGKKRTGAKAENMGVWAYGDQYYTDHVLRYYSLGGNSDIVDYAMTLLGCDYKYGATGPDKFDCSGFVYYVFKQTGVYTGERTTASGYSAIATPIEADEAKAGDLVFFANSKGIHHVGIYIGDGKMIHAPHTGDVVKISYVARDGETITYGRLGD